MKGLDIFLICLGVSIIIHCIFSVVIPAIVKIQTQNEFNKSLINKIGEIKKFNDRLLDLNCKLHSVMAGYKDIEDRKEAARRLSESIIKLFIVEPSIKKE